MEKKEDIVVVDGKKTTVDVEKVEVIKIRRKIKKKG